MRGTREEVAKARVKSWTSFREPTRREFGGDYSGPMAQANSGLVLFVEDEDAISAPFTKVLEREGFESVVARTAAEALEVAGRIEPDLVLLDLNLPDGDGRDVCRALRRDSDVPIVMLTARGTELDRVVGLEMGADDYVVKPFSGPEVISRIRAVLRRTRAAGRPFEPAFSIGGLELDVAARTASLDGHELELTRKEFDLLAELARHVGTVVTREDLMSRVWDTNWFGSTKTLDVHIGSLRRKLGDDPAAAAADPDRPRRRLPLSRSGGRGPISLRRTLLLAVAYVVLLAVIAFGLPLAISLRDRVDAEVRGQARSQADVVAASSAELLRPSDRQALDRLVGSSAESVRGRVIVVDAGGRLIADSAGDGELGASYASRPEIATALGGSSYQQQRHSDTLSADILATAVPILERGATVGAVRVTQSVAAVDHAVNRSLAGIALLGLVVLVLGVIAGALIARRIARPIGRLATAADEVAAGDLEARAEVEGSSEQRSLARSFNEMTGRLGRMLAGQREFVADASHQLRTPLTGLRLQLEELEHGARDDDARQAAGAALAEVDRLSAIVDELLVLSRAGEHEMPAEPVELAAAADRLVVRWGKAADARGIRLRRSPSGAGVVLCAGSDLDRALDALVENAIVYSSPGGEVVIGDRPGAIEVLDRGPGLEPGEQEAVLERFYRGSAGKRGPAGTGLGLADRPRAGRRLGWVGHDLQPRRRWGARGCRIATRPRGDVSGGSRMKRLLGSSSLRWAALALLGIAIAVAVGVAASHVASQRIGLASEPLRAGEALAPAAAGSGGGDAHGGTNAEHSGGPGSDQATTGSTTTQATTTASESTTSVPTATPDDSGTESEGPGDD